MAPEDQELEDPPGFDQSPPVAAPPPSDIFRSFDLAELEPALEAFEARLRSIDRDIQMSEQDKKTVADLFFPGWREQLKDAVVKLAVRMPGSRIERQATPAEKAAADLKMALIPLDEISSANAPALTRYIRGILQGAGVELNNETLANARGIIEARMTRTAQAVKATIDNGHRAKKSTDVIVEEVRSRMLDEQFTMERENIRAMVTDILLEDVDTAEVLRSGRSSKSNRKGTGSESRTQPKRRRMTRTGSGKNGK